MSKVKIKKSYTTSDSEEAKNFNKKWEVIVWEKTSGTIDSKVIVKSSQDLAEFLIQGWIDYGFHLAEGMSFDDERKGILLKEWGKQLLNHLKDVDWDNIDWKKEDED